VTKEYRHERVESPGRFKKGSFRTITPKGRPDVRVVIGRPKGSRKTRAQAVLHKKKNPGGILGLIMGEGF
jgi:hypothetical protein